MTTYLLSVYPPAGPAESISEDEMQGMYQTVEVFNDKLRKGGAWVFAGGLHPASTATVVRERGGKVLTTDGPFLEVKEHLGGFWVIKAPDLDAALRWASEATVACKAPVEVRPFEDDVE
jgi:hypothetical protein